MSLHIPPAASLKGTAHTAPLPQQLHGLPPTGYIRQRQLIPAIIPIAPATLWRWVLHGKFPKPVRLGGDRGNVTGWRCEDVREWLDGKAAK